MNRDTSIKGLCPAVPVQVTIIAPVVDVATAAVILDTSPHLVIRMMKRGIFPFTWDVKADGHLRAEYRTLTASVAALQQDKPQLQPDGYDAAEESIVPIRPVKRHELCRLFAISSYLYAQMAEAGHFPIVPHGGNGHAPQRCMPAQIKTFLRARRAFYD